MPRSSSFTQEVADEICERLAGGESLVDICGPDRAPHLPHRQTVYVWLAERPDFQRAYRRARDIQADLLFDEIVKIADARDADAVGPRTARRDSLRVNARRWVASKLAPHRYGDRADLAAEAEEDPAARIAYEDNVAARLAGILEAVRRRKANAES